MTAKLFCVCLIVCSMALCACPAQASGWSWKLPPDLVTPDFGRRNPIFLTGEPITLILSKPAARYAVRDYGGAVVDAGAAPTSPTNRLRLKLQPPGWYKLYLYGTRDQGQPWGNSVGGTTFVVLRRKSGLPLPPIGPVTGGSDPAMDIPLRGALGIGPERLSVADASKPDQAIQALADDIALEKKYYLASDPYRKRQLMVAFPNGTRDLNGVRRIVARFHNDVHYWEPRNEPNNGSTGAQFAVQEMRPFYETVKGVDRSLMVMGPGTVTIGPNMLPWIEDFLRAGGGKSIDVFSFHAYNTVNGDIWLARTALQFLQTLLDRYGVGHLEKWQTEQGYFAAMYGVYDPVHQAQWTMTQMMVYEQFGIPKEHNILWYDKSHGSWDFPAWWENDDGSLNPAAPLLRVWSEELYGTKFVRAYDFGSPGNALYLGSVFGGPGGKRVAAFMSAGSPYGQLTLNVRGGKRLHLVSAFGVESDLPITAGHATLPVPELPVYVELAKAQTIDPVPTRWGPNLALEAGVRVTASEAPAAALGSVPISVNKIVNGLLDNWYWTQKPDSMPWCLPNPPFPVTVEIRLPASASISHVIVYAAPPWQEQSSLLDYELQYDRNGQWRTLEHVQEPARTVKVYTPPTRTTVDTFYRQRWIFAHHFAPVRTQKIRLLIHSATYGGGATKDVSAAGGQGWAVPVVMLREVEIYAK